MAQVRLSPMTWLAGRYSTHKDQTFLNSSTPRSPRPTVRAAVTPVSIILGNGASLIKLNGGARPALAPQNRYHLAGSMRADKKLCGRRSRFSLATGRASILRRAADQSATVDERAGCRGRRPVVVSSPAFYVLCGSIKVIPPPTRTAETSIEN